MIASAFPFRFTARLLAAALLTTCALSLLAAPSFRADKVYPNLGLRIRVLGNSTPDPLAQFKTHTYTFTRGEEKSQRDLFDPRELWYATQHAGQWRDEDGNLLILGKPTHLLPSVPSDVQAGHVSREAFDEALAKPECAFSPDSAESLAAWIAAFADCKPQAPETLRTPFSLTQALFFPVEGSATLVYAFRAKVRKTNGQVAPSDWFCAVVKIGDGTLKAKVRKDFETQFLANVSAVPQTGAAAAAGVQPKSFTASAANAKAPAAAIPDHPSRTAARKSIANMKDWWFAETPDYIFLSDIRSATGKSLVRELQAAMPALRAAFARLVPPFSEKTDVSVVRIFEAQEAYKLYVGQEHAWSIGLWSPACRELVILSQGKEKDRTMEIIRHEGFHQYLFYATDMADNAMWFNEGHACFFEPSQVDGKGRVEIPEDGRVEHLISHLDAAAALLPKLLHFDRSAFYSKSEQQLQMNYTTAWALVYFLRKGVPADRLADYENVIGTYLKSLAETKNGDKATAAAFEGVSMAKLQKDFTDFWKKGRNSARRYDPLAEKQPNAQR